MFDIANQSLDFASIAAKSMADAHILAVNPEAMAAEIVRLRGIITDLQAAMPIAKQAADTVEEIGSDVVRAIPVSWIEKMEALAEHAQNALGFRHVPKQ